LNRDCIFALVSEVLAAAFVFQFAVYLVSLVAPKYLAACL